jgi:hypothetical protein
MMTKDARCAREIKARIARAKQLLKMKALFTSKLGFNLGEKVVKY